MQALIGETNRVLGLAVDHGLRDNLPPAEMISKLRNDVFVFSACKTHIQLKEVGSKLVDENGKINGYQKFSQEVSAIHKAYNKNYLQAEYIFATSSAEMAAKWSRFEKDGDRYNLQYRTAQDNRVRDAHAKLAGTTLPVSDPFWDSYCPPNGWRCRCTAVQVLKEKYPESNSTDSIKTADKETTQIDSKGRDRNAMFRFNPGKQQVIFPPNHPYYKVKQAIGNVMSSLPSPKVKRIEERKKDFLKYKNDKNYTDVDFKEENGGLKATHIEHNFDPVNGRYEKGAHNTLYNSGYKSILTSEKGIDKKHIEGFLNERPFEIKSLLGNSHLTIARKLAESNAKGAEICVLNFPMNNFNMKKLRDGLKAFNGEMPDLIVISKNEIVYKKTRRP